MIPGAFPATGDAQSRASASAGGRRGARIAGTVRPPVLAKSFHGVGVSRARIGAVLEETNWADDVHWVEAMVHEGGPNQVKKTCELLEIELKEYSVAVEVG